MASVTFKKTVSDGNYGSEVAEVTLEVDVDVDMLEDSPNFSDIDKAIEDAIATSLATVRRLVHEELSRSPSANVRRAIEPAKFVPAPVGATADEADDEDLPY